VSAASSRASASGDHAADREAGIDPHRGAERRVEARDPARCRGELGIRILGAQARLHRGAAADHLERLEALASCDPQLQLDEIEARHDLGEALLHLEPGFHLQQRELAALHEELHGAHALVPRMLHHPNRRSLDLLAELLGEAGGRRLLEHLLVTTLHRAVAQSEGEHVAVEIGHDLHLHVPPAFDPTLDEDAIVPEGGLGLVRGRTEGLLDLSGAGDHADATPSPAGGGLEDDRVAEALGGAAGGLGVGEGLAAPGRDRDADLLGEALGGDLVSEAAQRLGPGAQPQEPRPDHRLGEGRILGEEPPARPHRIGTARPKRLEHPAHVEVGLALAPGLGGELDGPIGVSHEGSVALDARVEDERAQVAALPPA
jgi:hypothetical protein